jgi:hypothetical protein
VTSFAPQLPRWGGHRRCTMARQERFRREVAYKVSGPAGKTRKLKYVDQMTVNGDKIFAFRSLRDKKKEK